MHLSILHKLHTSLCVSGEAQKLSDYVTSVQRVGIVPHSCEYKSEEARGEIGHFFDKSVKICQISEQVS